MSDYKYKQAGSSDLDPASGAAGVVVELIAGNNVTVDNTDPAHPIVASTGGGGGGLASVVAGQNILIDATDPENPVVSLGSETLPAIIVTPEATAVSIIAGGGAQVQVLGTGGAGSVGQVAIVSADTVLISSTKPLTLPSNPDVQSNLNPATYPGGIIYSLSDRQLYFSNGTVWIRLVESVNAGTGIAVDNTDPANPIVSVSP